jgi:L-amino acid N-acyltransferase YncA
MRSVDLEGVQRIDELTQFQYLGRKWQRFSPEEKTAHLVSRTCEFDRHLKSGYSLVATDNKRIIGFLFASETLPLRNAVYIGHIAIHPKYQNRGIGMLLYGHLFQHAKRKHITRIQALINPDNPKSIRLHEKLGFFLQERIEASIPVT